MSENYGTCEKCGYTAEDFEHARIHARDQHYGISTDMLDIFTTD